VVGDCESNGTFGRVGKIVKGRPTYRRSRCLIDHHAVTRRDRARRPTTASAPAQPSAPGSTSSRAAITAGQRWNTRTSKRHIACDQHRHAASLPS
jgi:hypothetical protein